MAKYYGKIGYGVSEETSPGIWENRIYEREYFGDLIQNTYRVQASENLNDNFTISNKISILADSFAYENFNIMKYVEYLGVKWKIESIEVQYPRLILTTGGIYNGE